MAAGDRQGDQEESVQSLLWLFWSPTILRTLISRSLFGGQWPGRRWWWVRNPALGGTGRPWRREVWVGDVMAHCGDWESFPQEGGLVAADGPDARFELPQIWLNIRSTFLVILRRERPRGEAAHSQQRLANHLARGSRGDVKDRWGHACGSVSIFAALRIHGMEAEKKGKRNSTLYFMFGKIKVRCQGRVKSRRGQGL